MADKNYRFERIERLLDELRYEITRGMLEGEIDETIQFKFIVPVSKRLPDGIVMCRFETRPTPAHFVSAEDASPRLKIIEGGRP